MFWTSLKHFETFDAIHKWPLSIRSLHFAITVFEKHFVGSVDAISQENRKFLKKCLKFLYSNKNTAKRKNVIDFRILTISIYT